MEMGIPTDAPDPVERKESVRLLTTFRLLLLFFSPSVSPSLCAHSPLMACKHLGCIHWWSVIGPRVLDHVSIRLARSPRLFRETGRRRTAADIFARVPAALLSLARDCLGCVGADVLVRHLPKALRTTLTREKKARLESRVDIAFLAKKVIDRSPSSSSVS
jgi:hypothetical protein